MVDDTSKEEAQETLKKHGLEFFTLGILGQAGSGKDVVSDYFCSEKNFSKVAFADPMKRFVRKAFNLSDAQLWGPSEERNRVFTVNEEWWYNAMASLPGSAYELTNKVLHAGTKVEGYLQLMEWFSWLRKNYPVEISARFILQTLGTEWGRKVDPLMWVRYGHDVAADLQNGHFYTQTEGVRERNPGEVSTYAGVVIPDHRFFNEVEATQGVGYVIKVNRVAHRTKQEVIGLAGHQSESEQKAMKDEDFDLVLNIHEFIKYVDDEGELKEKLDTNALYDALDPIFNRRAWTSRKETGKTEVVDVRPS